MKKVVIESPYAGDVVENIEYCKICVRDSIDRGEAPIASHLLLAAHNICDDSVPEERSLGIKVGFAWHSACDVIAFYVDRGVSPGMAEAQNYAVKNGYSDKIVFRSLFPLPRFD
jgi:hypothetical protein